jgi:hypothetical protein
MNKNQNLPASVTILVILVLFISAWNILRAFSSIVNWSVLIEFGANAPYILGTALVWSIIGIWLSVDLIRERSYAKLFGLFAGAAYYGWYWGDRLFIQSSPAPNRIFSLVFSSVFLLIYGIILYTPAIKAYLDKEYS